MMPKQKLKLFLKIENKKINLPYIFHKAQKVRVLKPSKFSRMGIHLSPSLISIFSPEKNLLSLIITLNSALSNAISETINTYKNKKSLLLLYLI